MTIKWKMRRACFVLSLGLNFTASFCVNLFFPTNVAFFFFFIWNLVGMIYGEGTAAPDTMALSVAGAVMLCPAVPNLFGTRDQFCGRYFSMGGVQGMASGWFTSITFIVTSFLLSLHQLHLPEAGIRPGGWGPCNPRQARTPSAFLGFLLPECSLWHQGYILALPEPCEVLQGEHSWGNLQPWISDLGSPSLLR